MEDQYFMKRALQEARLAFEEGEIPVGAVVVVNGTIIAKAHNQVELLKDVTAHAEVLALTSAFNRLGAKYLPEATLFVTLEPCLMCSGALYWSKIGRVVYGASDAKNGFSHYFSKTTLESPFHPKTMIEHGLMAEECAALMKQFFQERR